VTTAGHRDGMRSGFVPYEEVLQLVDAYADGAIDPYFPLIRVDRRSTDPTGAAAPLDPWCAAGAGHPVASPPEPSTAGPRSASTLR